MNESLPRKQRSCYKCGYTAETADKVCPQCGRQLHTATATRVRGAIMAACGLSILGIMGPITVLALNAMYNPTPGGSRFNGSGNEGLAIVGLFGMLLTFGAIAALIGGWQLVAGRRNRIVSRIAVAFAVLIFVAGGLIAMGLKGR
jgi:hypothetical protein